MKTPRQYHQATTDQAVQQRDYLLRLVVAFVLILVFFAILIGRFVFLQVIKHEEFTAKATTKDIMCNDGELEDARWFTVRDIDQKIISLPSPVSISHRLINHWYHSLTGRDLTS